MADKENLKEWETRKWAEKVNAEARGRTFGLGLGATRPEVSITGEMADLPGQRVVEDAKKETLRK